MARNISAQIKTSICDCVPSRRNNIRPIQKTFIKQIVLLIRIKMRSLNARFYVSNKFILNSSNLIFKLEQWQVEVESTKRKVKRLKSEAIILVFLDLETEND